MSRSVWKGPASAALAALCCAGGCSADDCTTVEGQECCRFAASDSQVQQCGRIGGGGVLTKAEDKQACGQHCLEEDLCFWIYSAGGDYAGDCQLLGRCGTASSNRPDPAPSWATGTMHSAGCFSWGDAEPVCPQLRL